MAETLNLGWLKDDNGEKFAPRTLMSQVQADDGTSLDDMLGIADWSQNDETAPDYVKNRTHWFDPETNTYHKLPLEYLPETLAKTEQVDAKAPIKHTAVTQQYGVGTDQLYGHLRLSDSVDSTKGCTGGYAATPYAVRAAYNRSATLMNRTTAVNAADTSYTTLMARGSSLNSADTTPTVNGAICWTYK